MLNRIIRYFLENRVVTLLLLVLIIVWGISTSPFNWHGGIIPRNPIPVDAIPDIGDNQQISGITSRSWPRNGWAARRRIYKTRSLIR